MNTQAQQKLREAVWRQCRAWAEVYRHEPEGPQLIRSLLLGVENGIRRRTGTLPEHERHCPQGAILRAWSTGKKLAEEIPASFIRPFEKSSAARGAGSR